MSKICVDEKKHESPERGVAKAHTSNSREHREKESLTVEFIGKGHARNGENEEAHEGKASLHNMKMNVFFFPVFTLN